VIHFDRWWNPAVENQATDRAFRIGQRKDVMVHKLICTGTIEEKIDDLIESKKRLADDIIESTGGERLLMQMNENELINILRFDQYKVGRKTDA
jgi:non-specific serine/threonine protein kinase